MRYDTEHKQRTHERVVSAAAQAIRLHGPDRIGIASLMAGVGLTHGGFYTHFRSKDDLVAEAISHMFDERYAAFRKCLHGVEPAEGLARHIDLYLSPAHRDRRDRGCPVAALAGDLARMPAVARKRFEAGVQRLIEVFTEVLSTLGRPQPDLLAASVLSEMVGALAIARGMSNAALSERFLEAARDSVRRRLAIATVK